MVYKTMISGSYFGDYEVIFRKHRRHTIRAKEDSNILILSKEVYRDVIEQDYPEVAKQMADLAKVKQLRAKACFTVVLSGAKQPA